MLHAFAEFRQSERLDRNSIETQQFRYRLDTWKSSTTLVG